MDVQAEIRDLKRRVGELEGSFGFLTKQVGGVHKDLLAFQTRTEHRFDKIDVRMDGLDDRIDRVEREVRGLRKDLPGVVGAALRDVLREERGKPRK